MSWLTADLPPPQNVYPFEDQAGIGRTPFFTGYRGQLQRWKNSWRTYRLEFLLEGNRLRNLENLLWVDFLQGGGVQVGGGDGYKWLLMPLISESSLYPAPVDEAPPEQYVRIITPPVITAVGAAPNTPSGLYRVTFAIETQYEGAAPAPV